jgi:hypothetical protein
MHQLELDTRLSHWGTWTFSFENNEQGWPDKSSLYTFLLEGFTGNESSARTSSIPYKQNKYAEPVNALFIELKNKNYQLAQAIYVYYAVPRRLVNIRQFSKKINIHQSTFYRRLDAAKRWFLERLPD